MSYLCINTKIIVDKMIKLLIYLVIHIKLITFEGDKCSVLSSL